MDDRMLVEQFHLDVFVSRSLSRDAVAVVRKVLNRPAVRIAFLRAFRSVVRRHRTLDAVTITLTR